MPTLCQREIRFSNSALCVRSYSWNQKTTPCQDHDVNHLQCKKTLAEAEKDALSFSPGVDPEECHTTRPSLYIHPPFRPQMLSLDTTSLQCFQQLRPFPQHLLSLGKAHPLPLPLVHLRPARLLLLDTDLVKLIRRPRSPGVLGDLGFRALFSDGAEVGFDLAFDARFLPGFAAGGVLGGAFVGFPAAFGEDPAFASGGLDEEDEAFVWREGDNAGDETFAVGSVSGDLVLVEGCSWWWEEL